MTSDMLDIRMQENLQIISKLRLLDDDLMNLVFDKNIEATELLLNIILKRTDLKVLEVVAQREYKNAMAGGRSITIDVYAKDSEGKAYDVEKTLCRNFPAEGFLFLLYRKLRSYKVKNFDYIAVQNF